MVLIWINIFSLFFLFNGRLRQNIGHSYMIKPWTCLKDINNMCVSVIVENIGISDYYTFSCSMSQISFYRGETGDALKSPSMHIWSSSRDSSMELSIPRHMIYSSCFSWQATGKYALINFIDESLIVTLSPCKNYIRLMHLHLNVAAKISMPNECYSSLIS